MTKYSTDGTLAGSIDQRIRDAFKELAEMVSNVDMPEDETAGVPMAIFGAENYMLAKWKEYTAALPNDEAMQCPVCHSEMDRRVIHVCKCGVTWDITATLSEPDNLKQTNNEKETDKGPGLSGSERAVDDLYIAEVEYIMYKCGHGEIHAKGGKYHPLCPKCDDAMVDGVLDEDGRYQKWLRRKNESKTSTLL